MAIYKNKASQKIACFAYDSTDGSAKTGDAANITAQISLDGAATAATNDTNPTELDATDAPGVYLFDLTQAETNADLVVIAPVSATANILIEPLLIYTEPEQRSADVTAISGDSTAADNLEAATDGTGYGFANCTIPTVTTLTGHTPQTGDTYALANGANGFAAIKGETANILLDTNELQTNQGNWLTASGFSTHDAADVVTAMQAVAADFKADVSGLALESTLTTIAGYLDTEIAAILEDTGTTLPAQISGLSIPTAAQIRSEIDSNSTQLAAILEDTGTTLPATLSSGVAVSSLTSAAITDVWSTDTLTESYAADGAAGTPAQILYLIQQSMTEFAISGTTITVKKLDGSTTAATFTLDDGTAPTSRTRAT